MTTSAVGLRAHWRQSHTWYLYVVLLRDWYIALPPAAVINLLDMI